MPPKAKRVIVDRPSPPPKSFTAGAGQSSAVYRQHDSAVRRDSLCSSGGETTFTCLNSIRSLDPLRAVLVHRSLRSIGVP